MKPRSDRWKLRATKLADFFPLAELHPAVIDWAECCPRRTRWNVGFSGGADSLLLLLLLWAHWPERRARLRVLHFNHRLRGRHSRADEKFAEEVCAALGVEFIVGKWTEAHAGASEAQARGARMAFFEKAGRVLWLGHQQDDIAESMLMRLARGSGTAGLAAPRPISAVAHGRVHLRLLLTVKKDEIIRALKAAKAPWREDASNALPHHFRNRVRQQVIPVWGVAAQRDALAGAAHARELLEEDDVALEAWLATLRTLRRDGGLGLRKLAGKPRGLVRRALNRWLLTCPRAGELSRQGFESLLAAVTEGLDTRHSLGREGFAVIKGRILRFERIGRTSRRFPRGAN